MHWILCVVGSLLLLGAAVPSPVLAATRLGLFHTQEEVWCWRQRAGLDAQGTHGITCPVRYKSSGDVSPNSPGDWDRIVSNRTAFAANPSNGRWVAPPTINGCVDPASGAPVFDWPEQPVGGTNLSHRIRDAAFYGLVTGDTSDQAALKTELLWVSSQPFTQFGNPAGIWCFGIIFESPAYVISSVMVRLLFAYDYLGRAVFSPAELDQLDRWFFDASDFLRRDVDFSQDEKFVDRWNGNYTLTQICDGDVDPYVGGPMIQSYAKFNNNRRGSIMRYAAVTSVYLTVAGRNYTNGRYGTQAHLSQTAHMFVQEHLRFSTFPQGLVGEFERRGAGGNQEQGWGYAGAVLGVTMAIADVFARNGDPSLYTHSTNLGACGTAGTINDGGSRAGQNKDLLFQLQLFMNYITDQYNRHWPDTSTIDNRIDGRYPRDGSTWHGVHESNLVMGNVYFQDAFVKQAYTRTHANSVGYPTNPIAGPPPWMGEMGIFPGVLFMFGNLEGQIGLGQPIDPYNLAASTAPTCTITAPNGGSNTTVSSTPLTTLAGTASDDVAVSSVAVACSPSCGSPTVSGTTSWSVASLPLQVGDNVITCTATDGDSQQGTDQITVTYTPPAASVTSPASVYHRGVMPY